ncbi:hypothetical protein BASA50_001993 [Batrachochytrium salamandrivorans]|uniref:Calcineurin-like phosphoesterase domain-containing protein n=1 Tax=Batrachochytrium salamandrivorans TaxID=1357716 RepID=A0ABQ8FMJ7_9FUNG|nr:hypothetical protein BASA50_001993 [Batrachochytrium salamandrivorans]
MLEKAKLDEKVRLEKEARLEAAKIEKAKIEEAKIERAKAEVAKQRQSDLSKGQLKQLFGIYSTRSWTSISKRRVVAVGDLHGDFEMSVETLQVAKIINDDLEWIAGNTILVQTGDVVDRGHDTIELYDLLRDLTDQAKKHGGRLIQLLGNHEVMNMAEDLEYVSKEDIASYGGLDVRLKAFSKHGDIGEYLRTLGIAAKVDDTVFFHAGADLKWSKLGIDVLNTLAHQELVDQDAKYISKSEIFDENGPLWYRGFALRDDNAFCDVVRDVLSNLKAKRMVIGHTPTEDDHPLPQDNLWVVVKNLSQQFATQQSKLATPNNALALRQKATANLEKILGNMASQAASTSEATQTALAAILARLEAGPVASQVVVPNNKDYPPLKQTGATPKRKTMATKPNPTTTTATTTTTTTTGQPSKDTRFADAVKKRLTHQQLVERQHDFCKAGASAWLALKRETSVPAHSSTKVELSSGLRIIYASGFPYAKPGNLRKAMQGARIRTSAVRDIRWISRQVVQLLVDADYVSAFTRIITSLDATIVKFFKAWVPRPEAAEKDKLAAISSFAAKTVTTIQRSPNVKARNFFRSLLASIGGKILEAATAEATKIRVQTPDFSISTLETVPKESLPVKKVIDKEPAAPAVDPPSDTAAEVTPATQDDGATPTVTPIADVEMCL